MATDSARFWDKISEKYAAQPIKDQASYEKTLEKTLAHLSSSDVVLEIGCGTGSTALLLALHVKRYVATDISSGMIDIARRKLDAQEVRNLEFKVAAGDQADSVDGGYDAVLAFNYLHLVGDLDGQVRRVRDLLKPGGIFISKSACLSEMSPFLRLAVPVMRATGFAPYVRSFRGGDLEKLIASKGFDILESERLPPSKPNRFIVARKR